MAFIINLAGVPVEKVEYWRGVDKRAKEFADRLHGGGLPHSLDWQNSYDSLVVLALVGEASRGQGVSNTSDMGEAFAAGMSVGGSAAI